MIRCSDFYKPGARCIDRARWTSNGYALCDVHRPRRGVSDLRALVVEVGPSHSGTPGALLAQAVRVELQALS